MAKQKSNKCRRCRGTFNCTDVDSLHTSCKCDIDLRRKVLTSGQLKSFLKNRCCTEGACHAILKGGHYHEGLAKLLEPACETCSISKIGDGSWKRSRAYCNWACCGDFNSPCLTSMLVLCRTFPNRLKLDQAAELEEIVTALPQDSATKMDTCPPEVVMFDTSAAVTVVADVDMECIDSAAPAALGEGDTVMESEDECGIYASHRREPIYDEEMECAAQ